MCMVSMVSDYGHVTLPPLYPNMPSVIPTWPDPEWQKKQDIYNKWIDAMEAAKEFDVANNEPYCEDPKKTAFIKDLVIKMVDLGTGLIAMGRKEEGVDWIQMASKLKELVLD